MKLRKYSTPSMNSVHICEEDIICASNIAPMFLKGDENQISVSEASGTSNDFFDLWGE